MSMQVLTSCPFLHCLSMCPSTCCAGSRVWVAIWHMIPGWCVRAKLFQGRKTGFLSDPLPSTSFSSNTDLCCPKWRGSQGFPWSSQTSHTPSVSPGDVWHATPCQTLKHQSPKGKCWTSSQDVPRAQTEEEQSFCLVHSPGDIWGEPSVCKLGQAFRKQQKYAQTSENIFSSTSTNFREEVIKKTVNAAEWWHGRNRRLHIKTPLE